MKIAVQDKLLFRIGTIIRLTKGRWDNIFEEAKEQYQIIKYALEENIVEQREFYDQYLSEQTQSFFHCLNDEVTAITSRLLMNCNIGTVNLNKLKINVDNI